MTSTEKAQMYGVEVYSRRTQTWETARWVKPRCSAVDAHNDRRDQVMRGLMIYGDSRVVALAIPPGMSHNEPITDTTAPGVSHDGNLPKETK